MPYDETLAERVHSLIGGKMDVAEKRMFGGIAFMLNGHMCCGVARDRLMLRLGEDGAQAALQEPHTEPMDFTGKPLKTMVYVAPAGYEADEALATWVEKAVEFAGSLPPK